MKKTLFIVTFACFVLAGIPSCKGPHCTTYSSSTTTGKLSKSVSKKNKKVKKKSKKSGGKMKQGKPIGK